MSKKAILVVSFGTSDNKALKKSIESTEDGFKHAFPDCEVRRAFTSSAVIDTLAARSGLQIDDLPAALRTLAAEEYEEVYVQPLSIAADKTYRHIRDYVVALAHRRDKEFRRITIGRPLLSSLGVKKHPDDYAIAIEAVKAQLPELGGEKAVVFSCNGSYQPEYSVLQLKLADGGIKNGFVYTNEGYPTFDNVLRRLQEIKAGDVALVPFVMVGSEHLLDYIAGAHADSARSKLEAAGYQVSIQKSGLGENPAIQAVFVQHLKDALTALETHHGHRRGPVHGETKASRA